jgi:hypothetical protein
VVAAAPRTDQMAPALILPALMGHVLMHLAHLAIVRPAPQAQLVLARPVAGRVLLMLGLALLAPEAHVRLGLVARDRLGLVAHHGPVAVMLVRVPLVLAARRAPVAMQALAPVVLAAHGQARRARRRAAWSRRPPPQGRCIMSSSKPPQCA